jgi:hypothetical protein
MLIFAHGRAKKVLSQIEVGEMMASPPVAANGVLYVASASKLYAIGKK